MNDQDRSLSTALADLAGTMPDDPDRLDAIRARIERNRRRWRAGHAVVGAGVVGLTVVGVGLLRPTAPSVSTVPATPPTPAAEPALPACAAVPPPPAPVAGDAGGSAKSAAASAAGAPTADALAGREGVKGFGTVVAMTDASITVTVLEPAPDQPPELTAAFTGETLLYDGEAVVTARRTPSPGDRVGFAAARNGGGGYDLLLLQVHPPEAAANLGAGDDQAKVAAKRAGVSGEPTSGATKNVAEIVSVQPGSLTLKLRSDLFSGQTITAALAADVVYLAGDQQCADPALAPGEVIIVLLEQVAGSSYTIDRVSLFAP